MITLRMLNEFYPIIRNKVKSELSNSLDISKYSEDQIENIITYNIQTNTTFRMKNKKTFKQELIQLGIMKE